MYGHVHALSIVVVVGSLCLQMYNNIYIFLHAKIKLTSERTCMAYIYIEECTHKRGIATEIER